MINELPTIKFACLDTETTGLSPAGGGKICELAISISEWNWQTKEFRVVDAFESLFNPQIPMLPEVIAIHGITNEMVKNEPIFSDKLPTILGKLDDCVIVAHNADFDLSFLRAEFEQAGCNFPQCIVVDTLKLARKSGMFKSNRLGAIAEELEINNQGWHRAMSDTKMTEQIFYHFIKILSDKGVNTLDGLLQFQEKRWKDLLRDVH